MDRGALAGRQRGDNAARAPSPAPDRAALSAAAAAGAGSSAIYRCLLHLARWRAPAFSSTHRLAPEAAVALAGRENRDMKLLRTALLGSALLLAGVRAAEAKIVYETYTGTISSGYDSNGRFGVPTGDLSGKTLKIQYRFDLNAGGRISSTGATHSQYFGGRGYGTPSISVVKVSVNGVTHGFNSSFSSGFETVKYLPYSSYDAVYGESYDPQSGDNTGGSVYSSVDDFLSSYGLDARANYTSVNGEGDVHAYDNSGFNAGTSGNPVHVTIGSSATAVPEPAALALLGLGAAVLAATRRR